MHALVEQLETYKRASSSLALQVDSSFHADFGSSLVRFVELRQDPYHTWVTLWVYPIAINSMPGVRLVEVYGDILQGNRELAAVGYSDVVIAGSNFWRLLAMIKQAIVG